MKSFHPANSASWKRVGRKHQSDRPHRVDLDIFARHARTREGAVQVELAHTNIASRALTRAWTHLARQAGGRAGGAGGGVGVRGPVKPSSK